MQTDTVADRVASNESRFREANEAIEATAEQLVSPGERVPFICECPLTDCREITSLTVAQYEQVRSRGTWFLVVPAHETAESAELARVMERHDGFTIMEKGGRAGEAAAELDPRKDGGN